MSTTTNPATATGTIARCGDCGAAAAPDQRYCLNCGKRRQDVPDPVSSYLREAGAARARVAAAVERRAQINSSRRLPKLSPLVATILVVIALLVGIEIGHSVAGTGTAATKRAATTVAVKASGKGSGSSAADTVATSKGKSYVQQESKLPTSVTP